MKNPRYLEISNEIETVLHGGKVIFPDTASLYRYNIVGEKLPRQPEYVLIRYEKVLDDNQVFTYTRLYDNVSNIFVNELIKDIKNYLKEEKE